MTKFTVAACQLDSKADKQKNTDEVLEFIDDAAGVGADLVAFPEMITYVGDSDQYTDVAEEIPGPTTNLISKKAAEHDLYVHAGSFFEEAEGDRVFNTSVLFDANGEILGKYQKMHLFDVDVEDGVEYHESDRVAPGSEITVIDTPLASFGLSICYDLRFSQLYDSLTCAGANVIFVPAAFTMFTGKDHWIPLLRARAIETQSYVVAPNQIGDKPDSVPMYGKTVIVDPWGQVISRASDQVGMITAEIDTDYLAEVRTELPSLDHKRPDVYSQAKSNPQE